ncbi:dendrin [Phaenicophaeus curvirostris]|uniref:dendrin n=1 Tax=Phaenicophaeus curvirostris TaxID=33595 RepID=UPI0037F0C7AC
MLGGPEQGAGRLRICERTKLLLVEIDTVACCSPGTGMAAGCQPAPPWTYRRVAGEYAYLEQRFVAEVAPPWPPVPPTLPQRPQDFASHPPPTRCPPRRREGMWRRAAWGQPPPSTPHLPAQGERLGPPSYVAHMQRVQVAPLRHGGPPPYISPPAYDAPHRTLQLRPPQGPHSAPPALPTGRRPVPGGWSHTLPRAATESGHQRPRGTQPSPGWGSGTPQHSQTLPRAAASRERGWGAGKGGRRGTGGHVLIDATRVVVRAQYVPTPQRHQVRYTGGSPGPAAPLGTSLAPSSTATPPAAPKPSQEPPGSPRSPWISPNSHSRGHPPPRRPVLYAQALREAVSRIRRRTAPDSDSEVEGGMGGSWRQLCRDAHTYSSSSSSLESIGGPPRRASPPCV